MGSVLVGPLQYEEEEIGEDEPIRCLKNGLWLSRHRNTPFCAFITQAVQYGQPAGIHFEIAVPPGEEGKDLTAKLLESLERKLSRRGSYRGKVLSLEAKNNFTGRSNRIRVHKLRAVRREEIILPAKTIVLLERNVTDFIEQRDKLRNLGMSVKKGLLFYGPPGTGKTHTIHYLAGQMRDHTTLLVTAEQVGLLDEYMQLARYLQPSTVVLEDVDLIARDRESMRNACQESLLNRLLNEMDGLREDAMVFFILTTNRPDQLEAALASRPGRVDQAIEFPLPDEDGRRKLVHLYSRGLKVPSDLVEVIVRKTKNASPALIKELMRRSAQCSLQQGNMDTVALEHVELALDEMIFSGGSLNAKLLGGAITHESG